MPEPTASEPASPVTTEDQVIRERVKGVTTKALQEGRTRNGLVGPAASQKRGERSIRFKSV